MPAPEPAAVLINGKPFEVQTLDGKTETVVLARLTVRQLYSFVDCMKGDNTPGLVALCSAKPVEWVDTLTDESFSALAEECIGANFQRAVKLAKGDVSVAAKISQTLKAAIGLMETVGANTSGLSQTSSLAADAAGSGNALSTTPPTVSSQSSVQPAAETQRFSSAPSLQ